MELDKNTRRDGAADRENRRCYTCNVALTGCRGSATVERLLQQSRICPRNNDVEWHVVDAGGAWASFEGNDGNDDNGDDSKVTVREHKLATTSSMGPSETYHC